MSLKEYRRYLEEIMPGVEMFNVEEKGKNANLMTAYTLNRLQSMFHYEGLPDTIPALYLELYLMTQGECIIASVDGSLYALYGDFGGDPDPYYMPTEYIVANPYLKLTKTFKIDTDCVLIRNDSMMMGLLPIVKKYHSLMSENELSMNISVINARIMSLITATTDAEHASAMKFIEDIKAGKLSAIMSSAFMDGIKTQPYANASQSNRLTELIEYEQYLKASLFNEIGLNANYNMKRESINSNESQLNDDMLTPLIDDMLKQRREAMERVNDMFGTSIKVDFASAWKDNEITTVLEMEGVANGTDRNIEGVNPLDDIGFDSLRAGDQEEQEGPEEVQQESVEVSGVLEEIKKDIEEIKEDIKGGE